MRQGRAAVCKRCDLPVRKPFCNLRSEQVQKSYGWQRVRLSDGGRFIGRAKEEGSTVIRPSSRQVHEMVERCCSCTWHSIYSTTGPSARACKCCNAGRQCTGCYCRVRCKNRGQMMMSSTTVRFLLGKFPRGVDLPVTDQRASPLPVRSPTSLSLRAISEVRARGGGGGARGGAGRRRIPRDGGGGGGGAGGRIRDSGGATRSKAGAAKRKTAATKTTAAQARETRNEMG